MIRAACRVERGDAGHGRADGVVVQLRELRGAGSSGPSATADPGRGGRGAGRAVAGVRPLVCRVGRPGICSVTDTDARLARKSNRQASILAHAGHVLLENRNGLVAQSCLTHAAGTAERNAALVLVDRLAPRRGGSCSAPTRPTTCWVSCSTAAAPGHTAHRH